MVSWWVMIEELGRRLVPMFVTGTCAVVLGLAAASTSVVFVMEGLMTVFGLVVVMNGKSEVRV